MNKRNRQSEAAAPPPGTAIYPKGKQKRQAILTTAAKVLAYDGYSAFTMRNIASTMGITLRNIQYYFPTKRDLFRAVVEQMTELELESARAAVESPDMTATERLDAYLAYHIEDMQIPLVRGFEFELWAMATRDDFARECRDRMTSVYCEFIFTLIKPLTPGLGAKEQRNKSALILAMLQGLPLIYSDGVAEKFQIKGHTEKIRQGVLALLAS